MAKALPTPYYQSERVTLYCGDCLSILPHLSGVDAVVTDPPYGIDAAKRGTIGSAKAAPVRDYGASEWDETPCSPEQIAAMMACSRWQIMFGGNYFELPPSTCWLVWDKQNTGDFADCELAWTNLPGAVRRVYWRWNGMIRKGDDVREHPTQKPLGVMQWCLERLPADSEVILDPFMGSGTTGVAAARMGKRFIGVEREEKYCAIAKRRIQEAEQAFALFEPVKPEVQSQMFTEEPA